MTCVFSNEAPLLLGDDAFEHLVIEVAKGNVTKKEIAHFLEHGE